MKFVMTEFGKLLVLIGVVLVVIGVLLWTGAAKGWFGSLPGDLHFTKGDFSVYFRLTTCLLISAILTLVLWLLKR